MNVFLTSDHHIGHRAVATMRLEAVVRAHPEWIEIRDFEDQMDWNPSTGDVVTWHDAFLAKRWDAVVGPEDIVYHLGDLSMQGKHSTENALEWIKARPGKKRLVPGNHDEAHPGINRDFNKWLPKYLEAFEWVMPFHRKKIAGQSVLMSHFPFQGGGDHTLNERYRQYRLPFLDDGTWLLHGHTHSSAKMWDGDPDAYPGAKCQIHVGVDAWDYTPVNMEQIADIITKESSNAQH